MTTLRAVAKRLFRSPGIASLHRAAENLRSFTEPIRGAAEETERALAELPKSKRRSLTVLTVRCPENELLLRVTRIPDRLPGARYDRYLVVPTSAATYRDDSAGRTTARAWFLANHNETFHLRCRCHPEVTFTPEQLRGESPPPPGLRVLKS